VARLTPVPFPCPIPWSLLQHQHRVGQALWSTMRRASSSLVLPAYPPLFLCSAICRVPWLSTLANPSLLLLRLCWGTPVTAGLCHVIHPRVCWSRTRLRFPTAFLRLRTTCTPRASSLAFVRSTPEPRVSVSPAPPSLCRIGTCSVVHSKCFAGGMCCCVLVFRKPVVVVVVVVAVLRVLVAVPVTVGCGLEQTRTAETRLGKAPTPPPPPCSRSPRTVAPVWRPT
jgi:hypothetical protein